MNLIRSKVPIDKEFWSTYGFAMDAPRMRWDLECRNRHCGLLLEPIVYAFRCRNVNHFNFCAEHYEHSHAVDRTQASGDDNNAIHPYNHRSFRDNDHDP